MKRVLFTTSLAIALLSGCKDTSTVATTETSTMTTTTATASAAIVYIRIDSLLTEYNMYNDLRDDYETKVAKTEKELTSKGRSLENDVVDFQEKIQKGLVTRAQATKMEQGLQLKQQTLMQNRDIALQELAEEEQVIMNNIHHSITEYLGEFNADKRYGMILSSSASGPVLNSDPSLDITNIVLKGLNKKYDDSKKK